MRSDVADTNAPTEPSFVKEHDAGIFQSLSDASHRGRGYDAIPFEYHDMVMMHPGAVCEQGP